MLIRGTKPEKRGIDLANPGLVVQHAGMLSTILLPILLITEKLSLITKNWNNRVLRHKTDFSVCLIFHLCLMSVFFIFDMVLRPFKNISLKWSWSMSKGERTEAPVQKEITSQTD